MPGTNQRHCIFDTFQVVTEQGWWVSGRVQIRDPDGTRDSCSNEWTSNLFTGDKWIAGKDSTK